MIPGLEPTVSLNSAVRARSGNGRGRPWQGGNRAKPGFAGAGPAPRWNGERRPANQSSGQPGGERPMRRAS
ncbi:MAG: hypothetical protein WDN69_04985 [Aliidongia sp.]